MSPKIVIHVADVHLRNFHRREEYLEQIAKFEEIVKTKCEGYDHDDIRIVIAGDLVHSKNNISNELVILAARFIRDLEKIGVVFVISGNHDYVASNTDRDDTLTAMFEAAQFEQSYFLDMQLGYKSGCINDGDVIWAVYSSWDDHAIPDIASAKQANPSKKVIGLFHGNVIGAKMPNNFSLDNGLPKSAFKGCSMVMAGHIHKRQTLKYGKTEIVYPSSLIQQDFGETVTQHGFEFWNLENNTHEYVEIPSEYGLYKFELDNPEDIDNDKERLLNL